MGAGRRDQIDARAKKDEVPFGVARRRVLIEAGELLPNLREAAEGYRALGKEAQARAAALLASTVRPSQPSPAARARVAAVVKRLNKGAPHGG